MGIVIGFAVLVAASATVATALMTKRYRWRWGRKQTGVAKLDGDHAYRSGWAPTFATRGIPPLNRYASWFAIAWALLTAFVFAPAGLLFCLVAAESASHSLTSFVGLLAVFTFSWSGFGLMQSLMKTSRALLDRTPKQVAVTARWSLYHHIGVTAAFSLTSVAFDSFFLVVLAGVPCAVGAVHALAMGAAAERMSRDEAVAEPADAPIHWREAR